MTESIEDLLKNRDYSEPEEITIIRDYIFKKYGVVPGIKISGNKIMIQVTNAALAGSLRMDLYDIEQKIKTKHQLSVQIRH